MRLFDYFVHAVLPVNKNIKIIVNYVLGPIILVVLLYSIYHQVQSQHNWRASLGEVNKSLHFAATPGLLAAAVGLMLVNWGIEARKWQLAIRHLQPIPFVRSLKAIFAGTTLAFFLPNRTGEYIGRVLFVNEGKRIQAISLTLVCSMAQLLVTLLFGIIGLVSIRPFINSGGEISSAGFWLNVLLWAAVIGTGFLTLLYFRLPWVIRWVERTPRIDKFLRYVRVLDSFNVLILCRILSLSLIRYSVFIVQYFLLFRVFSVPLNAWQVFWSISVVFLVLAILPTIALFTELGVRWKASIEVVQIFSNNVVGILATSLAVWIINLVIPAMVGSVLIFGIRFFKK